MTSLYPALWPCTEVRPFRCEIYSETFVQKTLSSEPCVETSQQKVKYCVSHAKQKVKYGVSHVKQKVKYCVSHAKQKVKYCVSHA